MLCRESQQGTRYGVLIYQPQCVTVYLMYCEITVGTNTTPTMIEIEPASETAVKQQIGKHENSAVCLRAESQ